MSDQARKVVIGGQEVAPFREQPVETDDRVRDIAARAIGIALEREVARHEENRAAEYAALAGYIENRAIARSDSDLTPVVALDDIHDILRRALAGEI